jgi:hypothetical protein
MAYKRRELIKKINKKNVDRIIDCVRLFYVTRAGINLAGVEFDRYYLACKLLSGLYSADNLLSHKFAKREQSNAYFVYTYLEHEEMVRRLNNGKI